MQLFAAARTSSQSESFKETLTSNKIFKKIVKLKSKLSIFQPDATTNLPPRLNIKGFSTAANYICDQVRIRQLLSKDRTEQKAKHVAIMDESSDVLHRDPLDVLRTETETTNDESETYFSKFGITEEELDR